MKTDYTSLSEKQLLARSRKGEIAAFDEIVSRNKQYIHSWISSKEKDIHRAEDLFQRTLIKSWKAIKKFKGDSSYSTWANAIARNLVIDDYRKRQRNREDHMEDIDAHKIPATAIDHNSGPSKGLIEREKRRALLSLFERLSEPHRKILKFYYMDELSYKEIAKEMKCSVGTVMSRLFYAKKNVKKLIKCKNLLEEVFYD